jgi:hypothetical protein
MLIDAVQTDAGVAVTTGGLSALLDVTVPVEIRGAVGVMMVFAAGRLAVSV